MVETSCFVEKIQVASARKQHEALELCYGVPEVTALGSSYGHGHYILIESSDLFWQGAAERLIAEVDPSAHLVQAPSEPSAATGISEVALAVLMARRVPGVAGRR